jgi:flagellar biosynthesis protein FlhA
MNALAARYGFSLPGLKPLTVPIIIIMILAMMILPLPTLILDMLFTFNIAVAMLVLMVTVYTVKPLDFAAFPSVLLLTTLMRLSLNVASTRVVLMNGHTGPEAAGKVIESFGHFVVGGNFAVGLVVFIVLVVINFVVITKGAGRIAEVSARFTLDAMPGKQMAIDADLNAGLIGEAEARKRRSEVTQEAEFYGSMDGASKFVRGDAIAGILILVVNIIGGLGIGLLAHDLPIAQAAKNYVLLDIGDGLVAQIPALVISTAAALIVTRVGKEQDVGTQMSSQLFSIPNALLITAGVMLMLGLIPGMPHFPFLLLGAGVGAFGWHARKARTEAAAQSAPVEAPKPTENQEATWDDIAPVDMIALEVGYRLIPLVDTRQDGDLLKRIRAIRKRFAQEAGFLPAQVHIRDNLELKPNGYRVLLKGVAVGEGESVHSMFLAIDPGQATLALPGTKTKDPAFGLPAVWIEAGQREQAQLGGYTVVDASTVVATHISQLMQTHAAALLGREEVQSLLDHFGKHAAKLIEDLVPKLIPVATLQKVLQNLLEEGVGIRDLRTILESLAEHAPRTQDAGELTARVRVALGAAITQQQFGASSNGGELPVMVFDPELEKLLAQAASGGSFALEPGLAETLTREVQQAVQAQERRGEPTVLLAPDSLRVALARLLRRTLPQLRILAHSEIPDNRAIRVTTLVGAPS